MGVLASCMSIHPVNSWYPWALEEAIRFLWTRVTEKCELLCECCDSNLGLFKEHPVLLIAKPFLHPSLN